MEQGLCVFIETESEYLDSILESHKKEIEQRSKMKIRQIDKKSKYMLPLFESKVTMNILEDINFKMVACPLHAILNREVLEVKYLIILTFKTKYHNKTELLEMIVMCYKFSTFQDIVNKKGRSKCYF